MIPYTHAPVTPQNEREAVAAEAIDKPPFDRLRAGQNTPMDRLRRRRAVHTARRVLAALAKMEG